MVESRGEKLLEMRGGNGNSALRLAALKDEAARELILHLFSKCRKDLREIRNNQGDTAGW